MICDREWILLYYLLEKYSIITTHGKITITYTNDLLSYLLK